MNIALIARLASLPPIQNLLRLLAAPRQLTVQATPRLAPLADTSASKLVASSGQQARLAEAMGLQKRPVRVLRVIASGKRNAGVGRMVISGSMADVCAELERLAAREAALT